jgi:hypothetical protein
MLFISNPFLLLAGILLSSLVEGQPIPPGCVNITIPVTITAQNLALPTTLDVTDFFTILEPIIAQPALKHHPLLYFAVAGSWVISPSSLL